MNVVKRDKPLAISVFRDNKNELVRRDSSVGIRGALPTFKNFNSARSIRNMTNGPRYKFDNTSTNKNTPMGPPLEPPRNLKRKFPTSSSVSRIESSGGRPLGRVLVKDSAEDTSADFCTPKNRPNALRYISSSSRGGYSGNRSGRSTSNSAVEASVILAISEGRGMARGEIGIAAVDLRHPNLVLCQFSDTLLYTHTLTKINYFNPVEIIVPHTFCEGVQPSQLYQLIKDQYPTLNLTTVQRRHFNDAVGRQQIQSLVAPAYSAVYVQVHNKFYALTAAAAVLKYVEYVQCLVFARESLKILYHSSENTMILDVGTATQLELVQPLIPSAGATCCLLGVLGPTYTTGGIRALRASILQPSCNRAFIEARLDAVQDLIENDDGLMVGLQDVIKKLSEIDKILFLCVETPNQGMDKMGEAQLNQTLLLKTTMELVPRLIEALDCAVADRLRVMQMDFKNPHYKEISDRIRNIIQEDAHLEKGAMGSLQRCFAVKPDINGLLDVARRTYSELIEDIQKIVEQLSETYDIPIRLSQNMLKGFHIILPIAPKNRRDFRHDKLPDVFIQVQNNGASISMTTEELVVLDQQAKESLKEIQRMSNIVIGGLLKELRPFMASLYKLCENVAELDILIALAQVSSAGAYVRPEFGEHMDVRNSVHPLLDYNSHTMPVSNDIYACQEHNFTIITGPNMGGKSIYIKQVALMQIMAQVGCFVPSTKAVLRLSDRVFSRIGFNDSVELNASTFVLEMKEIQHILQGITPTSLVIIDELCRGTNIEEGTSIAWSICEELIASDAYTFFTTHFLYLTRLQDLYYNVVNLHTLVTEDPADPSCPTARPRLQYQHKLSKGVTAARQYGLALAARTNLPPHTVQLAAELADLITEGRKPHKITSPENKIEKLLYELNAKINMEGRKSEEPDIIAKSLILKFKEEHPELVEKLRYEKFVKESSDSIVKETSKENDSSNSNLIRDITSEEKSRSDIRQSTEILTQERQNYTNVRSSNELLNTIISGEVSDDSPSSNNVSRTYTKDDDNTKTPIRQGHVLACESSTDDGLSKIKRRPVFRPPLRVSESDSSKPTDCSFAKEINKPEVSVDLNSSGDSCTPEMTKFCALDINMSEFDNSPTEDCENIIQDSQEILLDTPEESHDAVITNEITDAFMPTETMCTDHLTTPEVSTIKNKIRIEPEPETPATIQYMEDTVNDAVNKCIENNKVLDTEVEPQENTEVRVDVDSQASTIVIDETDTEFAEAPTQAISDNSNRSDVSMLSIDEELMRETIEEIGEDIVSLVLTPPEGFRD